MLAIIAYCVYYALGGHIAYAIMGGITGRNGGCSVMFSELFQAFKSAGPLEIIVSILLMVGLIAILGLLIGLSMVAYFKQGKWAMLAGFVITIIVSLYPEQFSAALFYSTMIIIGIPVALLIGFVHWISR